MPRYLEIEMTGAQFRLLEELIEVSKTARSECEEGILVPTPELGHKIRWDTNDKVYIKLPEVD